MKKLDECLNTYDEDIDENLENRIEEFLRNNTLYDEYGDPYVEFFDIIRSDFTDLEIEYVITYLKDKGIDYHLHQDETSKSQIQIEHDYFGILPKTFEELLKNPAIDKETRQELFLKYSQTKDINIKNQLILGNIQLLNYIIKKTYSIKNLNSHTQDIYLTGLDGLIFAIENYNVNLGIEFSTYATTVILGFLKKKSVTKSYTRNLYENFLICKEIVEDNFGVKLENSIWLLDYILEYMISNFLLRRSNFELAKTRILNFLKKQYGSLKQKLTEIDSRPLGDNIDLERLNGILNRKLEKLTERQREAVKLCFELDGNSCSSYQEAGLKLNCSNRNVYDLVSKALINLREDTEGLEPYRDDLDYEIVKTYSRPRI